MDIKTVLADKGHEVETVGPDLSVEDAAKIITEKKIGSVLVVEGEEILGLVNEHAMVNAIAIHGADVVAQPVSKIMDTNVMVCSPSSSVDVVRSHMTKMSMRHLPVVDDGKLVGIVSIGDVLSYRIRELNLGGESRFQHWFESEGVVPLKQNKK